MLPEKFTEDSSLRQHRGSMMEVSTPLKVEAFRRLQSCPVWRSSCYDRWLYHNSALVFIMRTK